MTAHRTVIEVGPGTVRRLCCAGGDPVHGEAVAAALDGIDEPVVLVDEQPIAVPALWCGLLRSLACPDREPNAALVIHPSWWSPSRVGLVTAAARTLAGDVLVRPRALSLVGAAPAGAVVVEVAARLVALTTVTAAGTATVQTVAEPRCGSPEQVVDAVQRRVIDLTGGTGDARDARGAGGARGARGAGGAGTEILVDGPPGVGGAPALAVMIIERLRVTLAGARAELVDESRLVAAAHPQQGEQAQPIGPEPARAGRGPRRATMLAASIAVLGVAAFGVGARTRHDAPAVPVAEVPAARFLVEGRVAVLVPTNWPVRRVIGGPGSARVEVISPVDPQALLHLTQSVTPDATLDATAASLKEAMDRANSAEAVQTAAPSGVFVDFNPSDTSAGRSAVTYREIRGYHQIDWTVFIDGPMRISIGCQHRPADADVDAMRAVCEQAVRSARALG